MWSREDHAEARAAAMAYDSSSMSDADECGLRAALFLTDALDEIERLSGYIQDLWAKEGITPNPSLLREARGKRACQV